MDPGDPATGAGPTIGLPPPKDAPAPRPDPRTLWFARAVNLVGLVSPAANLGLFWVGPRSRRWFGLVAGLLCAALLAYARWRDVGWLGWTAAGVHYALVLVGLLHPLWVVAVADAWAAFGALLGKVMAYPIFALVYYLVVTPTALVLRAFGRDPLARKAPPQGSYWTPHTPPGKERYERQF